MLPGFAPPHLRTGYAREKELFFPSLPGVKKWAFNKFFQKYAHAHRYQHTKETCHETKKAIL